MTKNGIKEVSCFIFLAALIFLPSLRCPYEKFIKNHEIIQDPTAQLSEAQNLRFQSLFTLMWEEEKKSYFLLINSPHFAAETEERIAFLLKKNHATACFAIVSQKKDHWMVRKTIYKSSSRRSPRCLYSYHSIPAPSFLEAVSTLDSTLVSEIEEGRTRRKINNGILQALPVISIILLGLFLLMVPFVYLAWKRADKLGETCD